MSKDFERLNIVSVLSDVNINSTKANKFRHATQMKKNLNIRDTFRKALYCAICLKILKCDVVNQDMLHK